VKNYLRVVFDKLGVWTRLELALYIVSHGGSNWPEAAPVPAEPPSVLWRMPPPAVATAGGSHSAAVGQIFPTAWLAVLARFSTNRELTTYSESVRFRAH